MWNMFHRISAGPQWMVLHIGIDNEMEIHCSVVLISRYAKISQTQSAEQRRLPSWLFETWRVCEIKEHFLFIGGKHSPFHTSVLLKTHWCFYILDFLPFLRNILEDFRDEGDNCFWWTVLITKQHVRKCPEDVIKCLLLLPWGLMTETVSCNQQQISDFNVCSTKFFSSFHLTLNNTLLLPRGASTNHNKVIPLCT